MIGSWQELTRRGARFLPHVGVGADPAWTEHGVFVLDLEIADALALAAAYGQNAVVAIARGEPARLLLTSLLPPLTDQPPARGTAVPIRQSRVTMAASSASLQPSVPAGRSGSTR